MKKILIRVILPLLVLAGLAKGLDILINARDFQFFGGITHRIDTDEKVVALTFDDGPAENTDAILDILKKHQVKGTFYLIGSDLEKNMDKGKKIAAEGHEIGNHSYSHTRMVFKTPSFIREEIEKTDELIRQAGYQGEIHFRPPYGKKFVFLPQYLSETGRRTITWDVEPETYAEIDGNAEKITEHVLANTRPGSIILLHVMYENRKASLESVDAIIQGLKAKGYRFVTVSELLKLQPHSPSPS
ncbi:polysaccharide deacetylase family protein [Staphylospora marina]|uniref:polysaccharide deacetylase family protein n=1 Tax=Staphylospora marina TaxID=2490858 RepID=UPI000F5C1B8F|nr:polysaccharide deacetylase family protein [Staphylospora marina]